ncbi:MAG: radical SAM protein [Bacillota bacterium]|nr:radical SAM protein [Bacillota bacterium]
MIDNNELTAYLSRGIKNIITHAIRGSLKNPREAAFLLGYQKHSTKAGKLRSGFEDEGRHIPAFLISSITQTCNLHCKGCYARSNGICCDEKGSEILSSAKWSNIFKQAEGLGIGFNLLAGGEPLMRRDVIDEAAKQKKTIFPIFTNGTMIDEEYIEVFDTHRNLIPVISIEGDEQATDERRGNGIYRVLSEKMDKIAKRHILFGASITVTAKNINQVTDSSFIEDLKKKGCKLIFFIEYIPVSEGTQNLVLSDIDRNMLEQKVNLLKKVYKSILFLSFPGDEEKMGGCLAAGRGFIHINPYGGVEACPFSPYGDCSLKNSTLIDVIKSPFFEKLRMNLLSGEHNGGCALFNQQEKVEELLQI